MPPKSKSKSKSKSLPPAPPVDDYQERAHARHCRELRAYCDIIAASDLGRPFVRLCTALATGSEAAMQFLPLMSAAFNHMLADLTRTREDA